MTLTLSKETEALVHTYRAARAAHRDARAGVDRNWEAIRTARERLTAAEEAFVVSQGPAEQKALLEALIVYRRYDEASLSALFVPQRNAGRAEAEIAARLWEAFSAELLGDEGAS